MHLSFSSEQMQQLQRYIAEVELFNPVYKLVGAEGNDLVIRHIFDSLSAVGKISELARKYESPSFADLGSGAGLPGIPLSIALKDYSFTLVERMERRVNFFAKCPCSNRSFPSGTDYLPGLEAGTPEVRCNYVQAFRPLVEILDDVDPILSDGGVICAYKGVAEQVETELIQVSSQCKSQWSAEFIPLAVPQLDANRTLCVLTKI